MPVINGIGAITRSKAGVVALAPAQKINGRFAHRFCALRRRHDIGLAAVGRHDAVEQADRVGNQPRLFVVFDGDRFSQISVGIERRVIAAGDGDLAEVLFGHARFVHVAAHDEGNLAVRSHDAEGHFIVARVGGRAAVTAAFAERRRSGDNQHEIAKPGSDRRRGMAKQRYRACAAVAAGE